MTVLNGRIGRLASAYPVATYIVIAFVYSWGVFAIMYGLVGGAQLDQSRLWQIPFAWGPPIAALVVVWARSGTVRSWLGTVADPRTHLRWYLFAAVIALLYADAGHILGGVAGIPVLIKPLDELAVSFTLTLGFAGSLEEFGWRGFAQPHLQERYDALVAAVIVGVTVGIWHYPWLLLAGAGYEEAGLGALIFLPLLMVLMAGIFAWLFNGSGGTIPVVMLGHAIFNTSPVFEFAGNAPPWLTGLGLFLWIGLLIVLITAYGREYLAPSGPPPRVHRPP